MALLSTQASLAAGKQRKLGAARELFARRYGKRRKQEHAESNEGAAAAAPAAAEGSGVNDADFGGAGVVVARLQPFGFVQF
mmetsp:Transcript_52625/g.114931  ORF Transcript_52625/g.114931 Transcript_52625/m.114931 type:complete len:81 (-) Transcript_52625:27-269(-)